MFIRGVCVLALCTVTAAARTADDGTASVDQVAPLRTGDARSFRFREDIDFMAEQLVAHVSWAPPDRRCLILCDRVDGLPLMIAVDGKVWVYDLIGGQILLIRAEPQLLARIKGDVFQSRWGIRADFPDEDSRTTIDVDPGAVLGSLARRSPKGIVADPKARAATAEHGEIRVTLSVDSDNPPRPTSFVLEKGGAGRRAALRFDSFAFGQEPPPWHHDVDRQKLAKHLPVAAVADADTFSPEARERLGKFRGLLNGGGLFILRTALREDRLRVAVEKNSPIKLDFEQIRANDEKLRGAWRAALAEQGFDVPQPKPKPAPPPAAESRE